MTTIVVTVLATLIAGLAVKTLLDRRGSAQQVTWTEFAVTSVVLGGLLVPGAVLGGNALAKSNLLTFEEFWSGYETAADWDTVRCEKNGRCRHTYRCDRHTVMVTRTRTVPDGNGGTRTETYTDWETRYHSCPYTTEEWTFTVATSLGDTFTIARGQLPDDPDTYRWQGRGFETRQRELDRLPRGVPARWQQVADRLAAGEPGPATAIKTYDNYLLASQRDQLRAAADELAAYRDADLLPKVAAEVTDLYHATKVYPVGAPGLAGDWAGTVMRFNAALGTTRQGDLHVVVVEDALVEDVNDYTAALQAYWSSPELGRNALSKNGLVLVLGGDDGRVVWARVFTGMPHGNDTLRERVSDALVGGDLTDPQRLLGSPSGTLTEVGKVEVVYDGGAFEELVFAEGGGFERVCMTCTDEHDEGAGFLHLAAEIRPTTGQQVAIAMVVALLTAVGWAVPVATGRTRQRRT